MAWEVEVNSYGQRETATEVDGSTLEEAITNGLRELGFEDNDSGHYIITVFGEGEED